MPWIPFVKTGYLGTNRWIPLVNGNGLTAGGGEPVPKIVWVKVSGTSPLSLPGAIANSIKSLTQYGLCTQASTPTPDAPVDIVCNNGVLRYGALGENLFDPSPSAILLNYYRNGTTGVLTPSNPNFMSVGYIPVKPNTSYVLVGRAKSDNTISAWNRIYWFDADKEFISTCPYTQDTATVATSPANAAFAQYGINYNNSITNTVTQAEVDSYNWTFCEGTAEPATFVPFVGGIYPSGTPETLTVSATGAEPQTVTDIPMLLSVGDYADEAEIISGGVTHRIGCHVFDGTETFSKSSAYGQAFLINAASAAWGADRAKEVLCTHFLGLPQTKSSQADNTCFFNQTGHFYFRVTDNSDINAWKAWLAEQYASGAPVIVWFVLAENVTESVTAQPLHTADGDNTVSVTANVSPVALECEYANGYAQ